ncbi:MAG: hypothetical protein V1720_18200 [bacterium]
MIDRIFVDTNNLKAQLLTMNAGGKVGLFRSYNPLLGEKGVPDEVWGSI